jgi:hypothetical protein
MQLVSPSAALPSTVSGGGFVAPLLLGAGALGLGVALKVVAGDEKKFDGGETWISQGGTPHGSLMGQWLGKRNVAIWGVKNLLNPARTRWVLTTQKAETEARTWENELFHAGEKHFGKKIRIGYDNGPDAFRHTYASASIVYRLMRERGAREAQAGAFLQGAGNAHERDSWLHSFNEKHGLYSSEMDVHNNILGQRLGAEAAARDAAAGVDLATGEARLRAAVLDSIGAGQAVVMDRIDAKPRAATWADIAETTGDGRTPLRDAAGAPKLRVHVPDAPGFPMPIANGKIDMSLPYAKLGPAELQIPRDEIPQA